MGTGMGWDGGHWIGRHRIGARQRSEVSSSQGKRQKERKTYKGEERREVILKERRKETNLVSNPKVELRGHVKAKILPAVHRNI